jgi:hypothetical protein
MAKQIINIGSGELTGDGESLRSAFDKVNDNFDEVYARDTSDFDGDYNSLTNKPTIPTDYGDHSTQGYLTSYTETDPIVGAVTGIVKADGAGNISAAVAGTDYLTTVAFADVTSTPTTLAGYGITDGGGSVTPSSTDTFTNKSGNISQWTNDSNYLTTVPAQTFASLTSKPTTVAGYGITDALTSVPAQSFASLTGKPTTVAGYGITDAQDALVSGTSIKTINGESLLGSGNIAISGVAQDFAFASLTGTPTTIAGYGITDALALGTSSTTALAGDTALFDGAFTSLTSKPTTIAGYGITDALALGTTSTTALAGNTALFSGAFADLTSKPTTIAGYGITDALALGTTSTTALAGDTALFSGDYDDLSNKPTIPTAYTDSDVDTHLNTGSAGTNQVLSWNGSYYDWVAQGGSGLQSRVIRTNQTSNLPEGFEADLDITGFKAYALMAITTDRAARVRLYVNAATRTADAARAEGVDPTSDAGLIAEVITTGAQTVIISPGAYGFNLESSTTTNIPCRVTNKSGGTSTVQVDLVILQLEA